MWPHWASWERHVSEDEDIYYSEMKDDPNRWYCRPCTGIHQEYIPIRHDTLFLYADVAEMYVSMNHAPIFLKTKLTITCNYSDRTHNARSLSVLDDDGFRAGTVVIDGNTVSSLAPKHYRFVCLSQTTFSYGDTDPTWDEETRSYAAKPDQPAINPQYEDEKNPELSWLGRLDFWVDPDRYDVDISWCLYNALMVDENNQRQGIGKIHTHAFDKVSTRKVQLALR
ncbi:hypothetical protein H2199_007527 [Coniosporium tulheliwenetii]|nr:hypothetical protein H2199_007527 [Cladosporium sp. JES 115]